MSVYDIDINTYEQDFTITEGNKEINGEVHTSFAIINEMLDLIPNKCFKDPTLKWLDPCAGRGYFCIILYKRLFEGLKNFYPDDKQRHNHIITNMIYMTEINSTFIPLLKQLFGEKSNVFNVDFLKIPENPQKWVRKYDMIIGNPPYNTSKMNIIQDGNWVEVEGKGCWGWFVQKAMHHLKGRGYLLFITPSIWMKYDNSMFEEILRYNIKYIKTFNNTESNKMFHGNGQTPTCYFLLQRLQHGGISFEEHHCGDPVTGRPPENHLIQNIKIYDKIHNKYIKFKPIRRFIMDTSFSLPLFGVSIIKKLLPFVEKVGSIKVKKTNMRPGYKGLVVGPKLCKDTPYPNIKTCILNGLQPQLVINFSNIRCQYYEKPKLVLAHKMYGFPFLDISGCFGISNRDNYVILNKNESEFIKLKQFLSTNFIITMFESTRYRMKYLERHIFDMLPDITKIEDFPEEITDKTLFDYFKLDKLERNYITNFHKKKYLSF